MSLLVLNPVKPVQDHLLDLPSIQFQRTDV